MTVKPLRASRLGRLALPAVAIGMLIFTTAIRAAGVPPSWIVPIFPGSPSSGPGWQCEATDVFSTREPSFDFQCSYWAPVFPSLAYGPAPPLPISQDNSGEDWWYDHKNSYAQGRLNGYIAAGYSKFVNWAPDELPFGCLLSQLHQPDHCDLEDTGNAAGRVNGGIVATMALIDPGEGKLMWSKTYEPGYFTRVIQTRDGGYLAIGNGYGSLDTNGVPLPYNPGQPAGCIAGNPSSWSNSFSPGVGCPATGSRARHILMVKTDSGGNALWQGLYALQPYDDPRDAWEGDAQGWDVIETPDGNFIAVGYAADPTATYLCSAAGEFPLALNRGVVIEVDGGGNWRWGSYLPPLVPNEMDRSSIVTAITLKPKAPFTADTYVISGTRTDADCVPRIFALQFEEPVPEPPPILPVPCPTLVVKWIKSDVEPAYQGAEQRTFSVRIDSGDPSVILLPAVVDVMGHQGLANVYKLDGSNGTVLTTIFVANAKAEDLRLTVAPTVDGGFGAATTVAGHPTTLTAPSGCDVDVWNTDGYVARFGPGQTIPSWGTQFDTAGHANYPGNQKKEECLFAISDDGAGGFVVSGHDSYNFEDSYMVRISPPPPVPHFFPGAWMAPDPSAGGAGGPEGKYKPQ